MNQTAMSVLLPAHSDGVTLCLAELLQYKNQTVRWLPPAHSIWSQLNGQHVSRHKGRGMNFAEVRPYQPGDDIRSIDWRVTARTGKAHTKLFTEEREQPVMMLIDLSSNMQFGSQLLLKSVQAAHFSSLISWLTVTEKDRIGAIIYNGHSLIECKPTARQQGPLRLINALIASHKESLEHIQKPNLVSFAEALKHLHYLCPKGSDIIVISDFYHLYDQDKQRLTQLRHHNRMQFVQIYDPLEQGQTQYRGREYVTDNKRSAWLDFSSKKTRQAIEQRYYQHQEFIEHLAKSLAIPLHKLSAAKTLTHQLTQMGGRK
ncbi:DUF58 domain-containing protein [Photobacterium damselae]|uniref:DUF58 domain-containing protein n=1 Tax=Photobacterium damselae TaxID=38293 RepID=UPI00406788D6